jgi:hypothetical protein
MNVQMIDNTASPGTLVPADDSDVPVTKSSWTVKQLDFLLGLLPKGNSLLRFDEPWNDQTYLPVFGKRLPGRPFKVQLPWLRAPSKKYRRTFDPRFFASMDRHLAKLLAATSTRKGGDSMSEYNREVPLYAEVNFNQLKVVNKRLLTLRRMWKKN